MNILLLNWRDPKNPKSGGAEIATLEHAKAWVKAGHKVYWFSPCFQGGSENETMDGVAILRRGNTLTMHITAMMYYFFAGISFDLIIDEIHGVPFFTPFYARKPKIAFIHEVANEIWDYMYPFPLSTLGKFLEKVMLVPYKKTSFMTVSESTKKELIKLGIEEKNVFVILNGLSVPIRSMLPKKERNPTYLFVSRLVRMKGVEEVIKAFGFIHKEDPLAKLWIVGRGENSYVQKLKQMVREYGISEQVTFWGGVTEKEKLSLMGKSHLLLHASVKEGWGLVVVEAASQGTPSVVYNVPGLRDSVQNGTTGIVMDSNSPQEMAKEALLLLKNASLYKKFQQNGVIRAKNLKWDSSTSKSLQYIERVTRNG